MILSYKFVSAHQLQGIGALLVRPPSSDFLAEDLSGGPKVTNGFLALQGHLQTTGGLESTFMGADARFSKAREAFSAAVIMHVLGNASLFGNLQSVVAQVIYSALDANSLTMNFFCDPSLRSAFPEDIDCTGLAVACVIPNVHVSPTLQGQFSGKITRLAGMLSSNYTKNAKDKAVEPGTENVLQVYLPNKREQLSRSNRVDPCVCANAVFGVLTLNKLNLSRFGEHAVPLPELAGAGTGPGLGETLKYMLAHLDFQAETFDKSTRYYPYPEEFLFFFTKLVHAFPSELNVIRPNFVRDARYGIVKALKSLLGKLPTDSPVVRMSCRVIVADLLSLPLDLDFEKSQIRQAQHPTTFLWPKEVYFGCGQSNLVFGSQWVATAFALSALSFKEADTESEASFSTMRGRILHSLERHLGGEFSLRGVSKGELLAPIDAGPEHLQIAESFLLYQETLFTKGFGEFRSDLEALKQWMRRVRGDKTPEKRRGSGDQDSVLSDDDSRSVSVVSSGSTPLQIILAGLSEILAHDSKKVAKALLFGRSLSDLLVSFANSLEPSLEGSRELPLFSGKEKHVECMAYLWLTLNFENMTTDTVHDVSGICQALGKFLDLLEGLVAFSEQTLEESNPVSVYAKRFNVGYPEAVLAIIQAKAAAFSAFESKLVRVREEEDETSGIGDLLNYFARFAQSSVFLASQKLNKS